MAQHVLARTKVPITFGAMGILVLAGIPVNAKNELPNRSCACLKKIGAT